MSSSNIFDELNAMLAGGNGEAAQDNARVAHCIDQANHVAPAFQNTDWRDVMRRTEDLNRVYASQSNKTVSMGSRHDR